MALGCRREDITHHLVEIMGGFAASGGFRRRAASRRTAIYTPYAI